MEKGDLKENAEFKAAKNDKNCLNKVTKPYNELVAIAININREDIIILSLVQ